MRYYLALVGLFAAAACLAQEQAPPPPPSPPHAASQASSQDQQDQQDQEVTIPAGTRIQVVLTNPIRTKYARRGDIIHAVTAFPVAFNGQVVIPAGTYLEGVLEKVIKHRPSGYPGLQMHFTRMLFASGYSVLLEKATAVAGAVHPSEDVPAASLSGGQVTASGFASPQFGPTPPPPPVLTPPPMPGPKIGTVVGIGLGVTAAGIIGGILWAHHLRNDVLFDVGSSFEVLLDSPVSLNIDLVAPAGQ